MIKGINFKRINSNSGFTLVELMIASAVFGTVLLLITIAVMQIGRTYFKGITSTRTQEAARSITDEVAQALQFGSGDPVIVPGMVCSGGKKFSYQIDQQVVGGSGNALKMVEVTNCDGQTPNMAVGREMLGNRMRLADFNVAPLSATNDLYEVRVRVVTGDNEVLTPNRMECRLDPSTAHYCSASELTTVVQKRVR